MNKCTYEESVKWMRSKPELAEFVKQCYLDADNLEAAKRFAASAEFDEVATLLKVRGKRLRVLDIGCGNGIASYAFASLGHDVYAVDPDSSDDVGLKAAARLKAHVPDHSITACEAFAESLPFANSYFDVVYARQALHHFGDLKRGVAECARVLKRGGLMLATREHVVDDESQLAEFLENHILHQWHGGENAHPLATYIAAFEEAGFNVQKCLAPFDSVINHYPTESVELKERMIMRLQRSFGSWVALNAARLSIVEKLYRRRLSAICVAPGRLYSFLGIVK